MASKPKDVKKFKKALKEWENEPGRSQRILYVYQQSAWKCFTYRVLKKVLAILNGILKLDFDQADDRSEASHLNKR